MGLTEIFTLLTPVALAVGSAVGFLGKWVMKQLDDCKSEHKQSRARIEELHDEIKVVSINVGELRGQLFAYKTRESDVDRHSDHD